MKIARKATNGTAGTTLMPAVPVPAPVFTGLGYRTIRSRASESR